MSTRECEFCKDWTPEYLEEFYTKDLITGEYPVCGACEGTRELDSRACFCHAWDESECGCNADWNDEE